MAVERDEWHPPTQATMPDGPESFPDTGVNSLASIGARWLARFIDTMVLGVPFTIGLTIVAVIVAGGAPDPETTMTSDSAMAWTWGAAIGLALAYETLTVFLWGQTLGKLVLGVRVVRLANGRCPLWWEAALRVTLPGAVAVIPHPLAKAAAIGLFGVAIFDPMRRSVSDRAAGTVVVRAR
ncbi:RDD family protein [Iamia sp.]|uniref:RDD family protein n=1 Tax=Iamia sp. TaxID=2722710 RepID=UPI002B777B12|nr:RDD family protein [Iamia sp.]HXH55920.1 RDD family protein [Iamia sp.]